MSQTTNPFEHQHHHHDDPQVDEVLDPAQESLADALKVSFWILKILMIIVLVAYCFSNWFNVDQQHVAVRLRFGRIVGQTPQQQVLLPGGPHLAFPYPIDKVVQVPTTPTTVDLDDQFWWSQPPGGDPAQVKQGPLNPAQDGSLVTADANIIHARWSVTYQIKSNSQDIDPQAVLAYIHNVGSEEAADRIARAAVEQGIVRTAAATTAEQLMRGQFEKGRTLEWIQQTLDALGTGLEISQLNITKPAMPGSVADAYRLVTEAVSDRAKAIAEGRKQRDEILKNAAGEAHEDLWALLQAYEQAHVGDLSEDVASAESLLKRVGRVMRQGRINPEDVAGVLELSAAVSIGGEVAAVISQARSYRDQVKSTAQREAREFEDLLPQFTKNRTVFMTDRFSAALEGILTSKTVETHYVDAGMDVIIQSNPDPKIKQQDEERNIAEQGGAGR
jgi:membrane protease subunit HflK